MSAVDIDLYLGDDAVGYLVEFCQKRGLSQFMLVADRNTYQVLGSKAEAQLRAQGWDVKTVVFQEAEVVPDEAFIFQVLLQADALERTYIAVGTGTLTDITRFASHRNRRPFISLPTAPSVDGFTSPSASLVVARLKQTVVAQTPIAVIGDLPTLAASPQAMIAAGFGDILGKAIALADWQVGHLVWGEPYSAEIAQRVRQVLEDCTAAVPQIGRAEPAGIEKLMFGLADTGLSMLHFGNSRPASGAEHYMSHFLELKLLREGRPAVLHGAKVGMCSIWMAELYAQMRGLSRDEVAKRLAAAVLPERESEIRRIQAVYGPIADKLAVEQAPFLDLTAQDFAALKERILDQWDALLAIAREVATPEQFADLMTRAGGFVTPEALGLSFDEVRDALIDSHYIRNRFTIIKLGRILGLEMKGFRHGN